MVDDIWKRDEVESPCVKLCVIHPEARLCVGCYRSIDEITAWSRMSPAARTAVIAELPGRTSQLAKRRGGRAGRTVGTAAGTATGTAAGTAEKG